jgi:hypothetical protein
MEMIVESLKKAKPLLFLLINFFTQETEGLLKKWSSKTDGVFELKSIFHLAVFQRHP